MHLVTTASDRISKVTPVILALVVMTSSSWAGNLTESWIVTDLGEIETTGGGAKDVNASGLVAFRLNHRGYIYHDGSLFPPGGFVVDNETFALNNRRQATWTASSRGHFWNGTEQIEIPTPSGKRTLAWDVNIRGHVVGEFRDGGTDNGFLWDGDILHRLDPLNPGDASGPIALNDSDIVVGRSNNNFVPVKWVNTVPQALALPPSLDRGLAWDINNTGEIVGYLYDSVNGRSTITTAIFWSSDGTPIAIGGIPGHTVSQARGINDRGEVVGFSQAGTSTQKRAFLYSNGVHLDLTSELGDPEWVLAEARALNDNGRIVGVGSRANKRHAFILDRITVAPPVITRQPEGGSFLAGESTRLIVQFESSGPVQIQWRRNGEPIPGATSSTLQLDRMVRRDAGLYSAVLTNAAGTIETTAAVIEVNEPPVASEATISGDPVVGGMLEAFYSYADADNDPEGATQFRWFRSDDSQGANRTLIPGATSTTYSMTPEDEGFWLLVEITPIAQGGSLTGTPVETQTFWPVQANPGGEPPTITTQPEGGAFLVGETAQLSVGFSSNLFVRIQWRKDGIPIPGATANTLVLDSLVPGDTGTYSVQLTNSVGSTTSVGVLVSVGDPSIKETASFEDPTDEVGDRLGEVIEIEGDFLFLGAPSDRHGAVKIYRRDSRVPNGWRFIQTLREDTGVVSSPRYGWSIVADGDTLVVGTQSFNFAYVYTLDRSSTWTWRQTITAGNPGGGIGFSYALDIDGDTLVIGAYKSNDPGASAGAVHVYERNPTTGMFEEEIILANASAQQDLGKSVAISGDYIIAGLARFSLPTATSIGAAFIYERRNGTWQFVKQVEPTGLNGHDMFSFSVDIDGTTAVVGAPNADFGVERAGAVYIFDRDAGGRSNWGQTDVLLHRGRQHGDDFGWDVALENNRLYASYVWEADSLDRDGAVFVYDRDTSVRFGDWTEFDMLEGVPRLEQRNYGQSLAISGSTLAVSAMRNHRSPLGERSRFYIYEFPSPDNSPPAFNSTPAPKAIPGQRYLYEIACADPDGHAITIGAAILPSWLSVLDNGNGTALLSGTPSPLEVGTHQIGILATDGFPGGAALQKFSIEVSLVDLRLIATKDKEVIGAPGNVTHTLTLQNLGPSDATNILIDLEHLVPNGVTTDMPLFSAGTVLDDRWILDLAVDQSATLRFTSHITSGAKGGVDVISTAAALNTLDQPLTNTFDDSTSISSSIISPADIGTLKLDASPNLNLQDGLFTQQVTITNNNPLPLAGFRLLISGLPADVQVYNSYGSTPGGTAFIESNNDLAPGESLTLTIEFFRPSLDPNFDPSFSIEAVFSEDLPEPVAAADGTKLDPPTLLDNGDFLLEFSSTPGVTYAIEYTNDLQTWHRALPAITANANRTQWIDSGPPKTASHPSSAPTRCYRVVTLPN